MFHFLSLCIKKYRLSWSKNCKFFSFKSKSLIGLRQIRQNQTSEDLLSLVLWIKINFYSVYTMSETNLYFFLNKNKTLIHYKAFQTLLFECFLAIFLDLYLSKTMRTKSNIIDKYSYIFWLEWKGLNLFLKIWDLKFLQKKFLSKFNQFWIFLRYFVLFSWDIMN
jgi:hypothetical protein